MQGNRDNENNLTGNEGGGDAPPEALPQYRSVQTVQRRGDALELLGILGLPGSSGRTVNKLRGSSQSVKAGKWTFEHGKELPPFPLEKAIVITYPSHIVAARICDSLRLRSVHAKYNGAQAICITSTYLSYTIDLYEDEEARTYLELIRINGCGFAFRREREAVVNAAQGKGGIPPSSLPTIMKLPEELRRDFKAPTEREHEDTLLRASDQLHSNKYDVQMFVLKNLSAITSSDKVNQESAQIMSRLIMKNSSDIQSLVVSVLETSLKNYNETNVELINSCLTIFSNALSLLSDLKLLENILLENDSNSEFIENVIPHLISTVSNCQCPHNACLALRCLCLLHTNSAIAEDILSEESKKYLKEAEILGKQNHIRLEKEAQALLQVLG